MVAPDNGGGIKVDSGGILSLSNVTVKDSESTSSTGDGGGGIHIDGGNLTMSDSAIHGNSSANSGGGLDLQGTINITRSAIYNNTSANRGGGIQGNATSTNITIDRSSIYDNATGTDAGDFGGGIFIGASGTTMTLKNSSVYNNTATRGAGLYVTNGTATVTHVTFAHNRATGANGAGVRRQSGILRLRNSIIANTTSNGTTRRADCSGTLNQNRDNLIEDGSCSADHSGDPKLASMTTGTPPYYALEDDSPAIGAGHDTHCAAESTDQAGNTRPATACDIGAVENSRSEPLTDDTPTPTATATATATTEMAMEPLIVNASCSLPDAITAANTDTATGGCPAGQTGADTITITEAGTTGGAITLSAQLEVNGSSAQDSIITINGGGFTVSGDDSVRVFLVQQYGDLTINNLTVTDGRANNGGGIKVVQGGILSLSSVTVKDSESTGGGGAGLRAERASLTIANSAIYGNSSSFNGGGLDVSGTVTISGASIYNNSAASGRNGGGMIIKQPGGATNVTIQRSSIYNNSAGSNGGGIFVEAANDVSAKNTTIYGNTAANGAGLYVDGGTVHVTHVTFVDNRATGANGVAVRRQGGTLRLRNTIIANTTSDGSTRRGDCSGTLDQNRDNLIEDGSCSAEHSGDPKLASTTTGSPPYYTLNDDSPAIGAARDQHCGEEATDQAGNSRPATGCDIGAVENSRSEPLGDETATPTPTASATATGEATPINTREPQQRRARSQDSRPPTARPTKRPPTGELLVRQGYPLAARYGLGSGVEFQRVSESGIGIQSVIDLGYRDAIDVWGYVEQGVEVCFPQLGQVVFLDARTSPRTVRTLAYTYADGLTCVGLTVPGTVVLVNSIGNLPTPSAPAATRIPTSVPIPAPAPAATARSQLQALTACKIMTTTYVNMRDAPAGGAVLLVLTPHTVWTAYQRFGSWFQVRFYEQDGWVSADYVITQGACG